MSILEKISALNIKLHSSDNKLLELVLREDGRKKIHVHKDLLSMASSVFRDFIATEQGKESMEVTGTEQAWSMILARLYPTSAPELQPDDVLAVAPIAHFFDFQSVLDDCIAAAAAFKYGGYSYTCNTLSGPDPITFIQLAETLQTPSFASSPIEHIATVAKLLVRKDGMVHAVNQCEISTSGNFTSGAVSMREKNRAILQSIDSSDLLLNEIRILRVKINESSLSPLLRDSLIAMLSKK